MDCQKRSYKDLQTDFVRLKEILKQRDELIEDSGLVLYTDNENKKNSDTSKTSSNEIRSVLPAALVSNETAKFLNMLGEGTIDDKLHRLLNEKQELKDQNSRLQTELEDERCKTAQLEKKLTEKANKINETQETSQEIHEIQSKQLNSLSTFSFILNTFYLFL